MDPGPLAARVAHKCFRLSDHCNEPSSICIWKKAQYINVTLECRFPFQTTLRIWDSFLFEGREVRLRTSLCPARTFYLMLMTFYHCLVCHLFYFSSSFVLSGAVSDRPRYAQAPAAVAPAAVRRTGDHAIHETVRPRYVRGGQTSEGWCQQNASLRSFVHFQVCRVARSERGIRGEFTIITGCAASEASGAAVHISYTPDKNLDSLDCVCFQ